MPKLALIGCCAIIAMPPSLHYEMVMAFVQAGVERGEYELVCLPLRLVGTDGSPVRAVLKQQ